MVYKTIRIPLMDFLFGEYLVTCDFYQFYSNLFLQYLHRFSSIIFNPVITVELAFIALQRNTTFSRIPQFAGR